MLTASTMDRNVKGFCERGTAARSGGITSGSYPLVKTKGMLLALSNWGISKLLNPAGTSLAPSGQALQDMPKSSAAMASGAAWSQALAAHCSGETSDARASFRAVEVVTKPKHFLMLCRVASTQ